MADTKDQREWTYCPECHQNDKLGYRGKRCKWCSALLVKDPLNEIFKDTKEEICKNCGRPRLLHVLGQIENRIAPKWCNETTDSNKFEPQTIGCKEKIIGRQHRIHFSSGFGKVLCGIKKWKCSDTNWDNVECAFCLRLKKCQAKTNQSPQNTNTTIPNSTWKSEEGESEFSKGESSGNDKQRAEVETGSEDISLKDQLAEQIKIILKKYEHLQLQPLVNELNNLLEQYGN
jgi:hypothetical protein